MAYYISNRGKGVYCKCRTNKDDLPFNAVKYFKISKILCFETFFKSKSIVIDSRHLTANEIELK